MANKAAKTGLTLLLTITVLFTVVLSMHAETAPKTSAGQDNWTALQSTEYESVGQIGSRSLLCNADTGEFCIRDDASGVSWYGMPDGLDDVSGMKGAEKSKARSYLFADVIDNKARNTVISITSNSDSVNEDGMTIEKADGALRFTYHFPNYELTIPLVVRLTEQGFTAQVEVSKIREGNQYTLKTLAVLPYFNAGYVEDDGFLFVPDGCGALIYFDNNSQSYQKYDQTVYSYDYAISRYSNNALAQEVRLPVYGAALPDRYSLGIITEGAAGTHIIASANTNRNKYNYVYPEFTIRSQDVLLYEHEQRTDVDIFQKTALPDRTLEVTYRLAAKQSPTGTDLALNYRDYLISAMGMKKLQQAAARPFYIDLIGATVRTKPLLGVPAQQVEKLTTFSQAGEILDKLHEIGVENVVVRYRKWSDAGIWGKMMGSHTPASELGGKKGLEALKKKAAGYGYQIYLDANPVHVYQGKNPLSFFADYAQNIRNYTIELYNYSYSTSVRDESGKKSYLVSRELLLSQFQKTDEAVAKWGVDGLSISGGNMLYTDFRNKASWQDETRVAMQKAFASLTKNSGVMVDSGNDYMLSGATHVVNAPSSSSGYDMEDESFPFYQIALRGLVNIANEAVNSGPDYNAAFLRALETGTSLRFEWFYEGADRVSGSDDAKLYYAHYSSWLDNVREMVNSSAAYYKQIAGAAIVGYERLAEGVSRTVYDNGVYVVVNYNAGKVQTAYGEVGGGWFLFGRA